ncbi:hypothetical protein Tco_0633463 [Tanacetum coccineum]
MSENIPSFVPRPAYVPAVVGIDQHCLAQYNHGYGWGKMCELLLRPQQVVLGNVIGHICIGDPRTMVDLNNLQGLPLIDPQGRPKGMKVLKEKLADFVKIKGGTVTFGGGDGKITRKGTIRTSNFNFKNVYYVEELQNFNLFFVSQICDTKNKVLLLEKELPCSLQGIPLPDSSSCSQSSRRHNLYTLILILTPPIQKGNPSPRFILLLPLVESTADYAEELVGFKAGEPAIINSSAGWDLHRQIIGDITSPVLTRGTLKKSKFGECALAGYVHDQQRNNHTDYLHLKYATRRCKQFVNQDVVEKLCFARRGKLTIGTMRFLRIKEDCQWYSS